MDKLYNQSVGYWCFNLELRQKTRLPSEETDTGGIFKLNCNSVKRAYGQKAYLKYNVLSDAGQLLLFLQFFSYPSVK